MPAHNTNNKFEQNMDHTKFSTEFPADSSDRVDTGFKTMQGPDYHAVRDKGSELAGDAQRHAGGEQQQQQDPSLMEKTSQAILDTGSAIKQGAMNVAKVVHDAVLPAKDADDIHDRKDIDDRKGAAMMDENQARKQASKNPLDQKL